MTAPAWCSDEEREQKREERYARWKAKSLRSLWWRRNLYKPGLGICGCEICWSAMQDAQQRMGAPSGGWRLGQPVTGCLYVNREAMFSEEWAAENEHDDRVQHILARPYRKDEKIPLPGLLRRPVVWVLTMRERIICATLIQWLGTNVGWCFLERCIKRCGYRLVRCEDEARAARKAS